MIQRLTAPIGRGLERLLARAFGRLPIGWLQLSHSRTRLAAALAGVAFANVLVFVQLGIMGSLNGSVAMTLSRPPASICAMDPPPAPTVWMSSIGVFSG